MAFIIEVIKKQCKSCSKEVYALFRSPEEFNNFQCQDCIDFTEYLDYIESKQQRD